MKKRHLIAALCASIGCAGAMAQASASNPSTTVGDVLGSVRITGIADAYAGSRELSGGTRLNKVDSSGLSTSQINFEGEKKLNGGLKAEFALGLFLRPDDGGQGRFAGDTFFGRNAYVGVGGGFGSVRIGRQGTGNLINFLKTNSFGDSATFGPAFVHTWISAIGQGSQFVSAGAPATSRTLTGALGTSDSAWNNSLVYISPSIGGTVFQAQWAPGEAAGVGSRAGASAFYTHGPLMLGLATEQIGANSVPASGPAAAVIANQSTWQLSGAYAFGFGRVSAGLINTQRDYTTVTDDRIRTVHLGVTLALAGGSVMAQIANSSQLPDVGTEITRTTTSLGYTYPVMKGADVYGVLMNDQLTGQASGTSLGLGVRYLF